MPKAPSFDIGFTLGDVSAKLATSPIVSIVGYRRSGKSTLAETLARELQPAHRTFIQAASAWCTACDASGPAAHASVDPEIVMAMDRLERAGGGCWIVDDAEVLFAYATDQVLASLGERLRRRQFSLILIRNRFVLEGQGWFRQRQSIVAPDVPTLEIRPMKPFNAVEVATTMFDGISRLQQAEWLATMSGGVPGLMSDLHRYTPRWPAPETDVPLLRLVQRRREELELNKPLRGLLLRALLGRVLPPAPFLSPAAQRELGILLVTGMISPDYASGGDPLQGGFWNLVASTTTAAMSPDDVLVRLQDAAVELESFISKADLLADVSEPLGVPNAGAGALALAFAASMYCQRVAPTLVQPLPPLLAESLGRYGLLRVNKANGLNPPTDLTPVQMVEHLIEVASH